MLDEKYESWAAQLKIDAKERDMTPRSIEETRKEREEIALQEARNEEKKARERGTVHVVQSLNDFGNIINRTPLTVYSELAHVLRQKKAEEERMVSME